jgi:hypothetical protein
VPIHLASAFYDLAGFRAGASSLRPFEMSEVGSVAGRSVVHLQCHIGLDTLSWARQGAVVSGLDFSAPAISAASSLTTSLGLAARFVVSDVYDAVDAFGSAWERLGVGSGGFGGPETVRYGVTVALDFAGGGCCGRSSMAELQPSKLVMRVRFPSPAPRRNRRSSAVLAKW